MAYNEQELFKIPHHLYVLILEQICDTSRVGFIVRKVTSLCVYGSPRTLFGTFSSHAGIT